MRVEEFVTVVRAKADASVPGATAIVNRFSASALAMARAASVAAAGVVSFALAASRAADDAAKGARRLGISGEEYQTLAVVADRAGTSITAMGTAARTLARAQDEARKGSAQYAEVFARLGVSVTDADGNLRGFSDILPDVIDGLNRTGSESERLALAQLILGRGAQEMASLIEAGGDAMREAQRRAEALTYVFDKPTRDASEALNDNLADLFLTVRGLANRAVAPLIPLLSEATTGLLDWWIANKRAVDVGIDRYIGALVRGFRDLPGPLRAVVAAIGGGLAVGGFALVAESLLKMATGLAGPMGAKFLATLSGMAGPLLIAAAAAAAAFLAFDDLRGFVAGEDSLTEDIVRAIGGEEAVEPARGFLGSLTSMLGEMTTALSLAAVEVGKFAAAGAASAFSTFVTGIRDIGAAFVEYPEIQATINAIADAIESLTPELPTLTGMGEAMGRAASGYRRLAEAIRQDPRLALSVLGQSFVEASRAGTAGLAPGSDARPGLPLGTSGGSLSAAAMDTPGRGVLTEGAYLAAVAARAATLDAGQAARARAGVSTASPEAGTGALLAPNATYNVTVNAPGATPAQAGEIARQLLREREAAALAELGLPAPLAP